MERSVWIGFDPRETDGYAVTRQTIMAKAGNRINIRGLILSDLITDGLYTRPTTRDSAGRLFDTISEHPMATEFAISRFLVPYLVRSESRFRGPKWALFVDSDILVLDNINKLFADTMETNKAVYVVKHQYAPKATTKMDGQLQSLYAKKNWSSVMLFNVNHPALDELTPALINDVPGRVLHGFEWIDEDLIGGLSPRWNYLVGHTTTKDLSAWGDAYPSLVHFTEGLPSMKGYENSEYASEWRSELIKWAR